MRKKISPEKSFEMEFAFWAKISRMLYLKIPDPIMTKDKLNSMKRRGQSDELQRPCDGILITKKGNYLIECKYNYNKLLPHQEYYQGKVNEINKSYYVIRKIKRKYETIYRIEFNNEIIYETKQIENLLSFFEEVWNEW